MKAVVCTKYGPPHVLKVTEVDNPIPREEELLVKIYASSITAAHCAMRAGKPWYGRIFLGLTKPKVAIPGSDLSGEIVGLGKAVSKFKMGDKIFAASDLKGRSYAEYTCLSQNDAVVARPGNMNYGEAASVLEGATTALAFIRDVGKIKSGQHILINGASGGIGIFAVQIAKYFGARVTGVCSSANMEMVKSLGADEVIDYTNEDFSKNINAYDVIFDTVGKSSFPKSGKSLKNGGIYMTPVLKFPVLLRMIFGGGSKKAKFAATGLRKPEEKLRDIHFLKELVEAGKLKTVIDRYYTMDQIAEAHAYIESGHKRGNIVLKIAEGN